MSNSDLFPALPLASATRKEPRLWIKELAVYREWNPDALQRRITLRTGLNIIWAKPSQRGAAGHAAGKTTFCRFVRYLLGDLNYGSETFRDAFRLKFPNAWIVGEIYVDGEAWLVARFSGITGPTHWSSKGATFDRLFDPELPRQHYADFTRKLDLSFIQPLPISELPSSGKNVAWTHLLAWLTRDQEARYDHVLDWRSNYSGAGGLGDIHNADRTLLIRAVLGLIQNGEIAARTAHMEILREKRDKDELIPKLSFALQRAEREYDSLTGTSASELKGDFLNISLKQHKRETVRLTKRLSELRQLDGVPTELTEKRDGLVGHIAKWDAVISELQEQIKRLRLDIRLKEGSISQEEHNKQIAALPLPSDRCGAFLQDALASDCPVVRALHPNRFSEHQLLQLQSSAEHQKRQQNSLEKDAETAQKKGAAATKSKIALETAINQARLKHAKTVQAFEELLDSATDKQYVTKRLSDAIEELDQEKVKQAKLAEKLKASNTTQEELRQQASSKLSRFCDIYSHIVRFVLDTNNIGTVKFGAEDITLGLDYSDLTSTALVTLKILILDLAALLSASRGANYHPGFLIHDSPREADLTAFLYHQIFEVARSEESQGESSSFQYIITTTEPPPPKLEKEPWLVHPAFSSADKELRFLRENL